MKGITEFQQSSSILRRLKLILALVAALLLAESLAGYVSSRRSIHELQRLNELNRLTGYATRGASNLIYAREGAEKIVLDPATVATQAVVLEEGLAQAGRALEAAVADSKQFERIHGHFEDAFDSFARAREILVRLRAAPSQRTEAVKEDLGRELFLVKQFELEVIETLRKARLEMNSMSDSLFEAVYSARFTPLAVSVLFSVLCFAAVAVVALNVIRRLRTSVEGLLFLTDRVAAGDLAVSVPVREHDEIGRLTFAFDRMITSLRDTREEAEAAARREAHLQKITAEFSRALEPAEVADIVVAEGIAVLGASAGAVLNLSADGKRVEFFRSRGVPEDTTGAWRSFELGGPTPVAGAIRDLRPIFLETREQVLANFDAGADYSAYHLGSGIVIPLGVQGRLMGVLTFRFAEARNFAPHERDFSSALGALASQAYYRASLYEEAQKAIDIRDSFLSIAAHELKTPLTSLKLQVQLGEMQVEKSQAQAAPLAPERLKKIFQVCHSQADRLNALVDDLLDVGRIESGTIVYNFSEADVRAVTESVLERFGEALRLKDVALEVSGAEPLLVICDPFRIEQVLINLLSNSVKYGNGKPVKVRLGRAGARVRLSVKDEGIGIAPEKLETIFNRFERAISARNISGLGLGLYISRRIVEAHRGRIWAESELGKGSEFFVELTAKQG